MRQRFFALSIDEIRDETPQAYSLFFHKPPEASDAFVYQAGQYLTLKVPYKGEELRRAFSLASSPDLDDRLRITIKRLEDGRVSNYLRDTLQVGDLVEVMPPSGRFTLRPQPDAHNHYLLIGAGSGITPLYSILRTALAEEPLSQVSLWYGSRDRASIIFREELQQLSQQYPDRLEVVHSLSQPEADWPGYTGRLDQARIYDLVSDVFMTSEGRKQYYLCGPTGLIQAAEDALETHAVNFDHVFHEFYHIDPTEAPPQTPQQETPAPVPSPPTEIIVGADASEAPDYVAVPREVRLTLDGSSQQVQVLPDQPILQAAINANLDPPYSCQSGVCNACQARLTQGAVTMAVAHGLLPEDIKEGYILTCQAKPLTENVAVEFE